MAGAGREKVSPRKSGTSNVLASSKIICAAFIFLLVAGGLYPLPNHASNPLGQKTHENPVPITNRPEFFNPSVNSTVAGSAISFRLEWTDSLGLSSFIFSYDPGTGSFANDSSVSFSGTLGWSNASKTTSPSVGEKIRWKVYAFDSSGNTNSSYTYCLIAGSAYQISNLASYVTITDDCYDILLYDGNTIENIANSPQFVLSDSSFVGYHEIAWNPQMTLALAAGYNDTLVSFDGKKVSPIATGLSQSANLVSVSWDESGTIALITGSQGSNGYLLEYSNGVVSIVNSSHVAWDKVSWNPKGNYALITGNSGVIEKFTLPETMTLIKSNTSSNLEGIDFSPDGTRALIAGSGGALLEYFDLNSSIVSLPRLPNPQPQSVKFAGDGSYALISAQNNGVEDLFEWNGNQHANAVDTPITNTANEVVFAPNDSLALVTTTTGSLIKVEYASNSSSLLYVASTRLRGIDWFVSGGISTTSIVSSGSTQSLTQESSTVESSETTQLTTSSSPGASQTNCCTSSSNQGSSHSGETGFGNLNTQLVELGIGAAIAASLALAGILIFKRRSIS